MTAPTPLPLVDLVVLDVAGTAVEEHGAVYTALHDAVVAAGGSASRPRLERWMGADKYQAVSALLHPEAPGAPPPDPRTVEAAYLDFRRRLDQAYRDRPPEPIAGAAEVFARLREHGVKVALTTGFTRDVATDLLVALGWDDTVLDAVVTVDDVAAGRPAPYLVFRAMERTSTLDVRRVLVAGDTVRDLQSGTNAGARFVVGVLTGGHDADTLRTVPHTQVVASIRDIPAIVLPTDGHAGP